MSWLTIVSVVANAVAAVALPWIGRKLAHRTAEVAEATATVSDIATGVIVLERAIDTAKLDKLKAGKVVTKTIRRYGSVAVTAVDVARKLAHKVSEASERAYEEKTLAADREKYGTKYGE